MHFPLSLRNVEDVLFERGIDVCYETVRAGEIVLVRCSQLTFDASGSAGCEDARAGVGTSDDEGEVIERCITRRRDESAALSFMKKALKRHGKPDKIVTDGLRSYPAAMG